MKKVFCSKCRWYQYRFYGINCVHPKNYEDSWFAEKNIRKGLCYVRNAQNDCEDFEEKKNIIQRLFKKNKKIVLDKSH